MDKKEKKNVVFWKDKRMIISSKILRDMRHKAKHNGTGKFRYCFHENEEAVLHEMLFTSTRDSYFRPHCHDEDELQIVISGKMYVIYFDEKGLVMNSFLASKKDNNIYRINKGQWHMNLPITKTITLFEVKKGPFTASSNHYPDWAPKNGEDKEIKRYIKKIKRSIV